MERGQVQLIREHWPLLDLARFFVYQDSVTESFKMAQAEPTDGQRTLLLGNVWFKLNCIFTVKHIRKIWQKRRNTGHIECLA